MYDLTVILQLIILHYKFYLFNVMYFIYLMTM